MYCRSRTLGLMIVTRPSFPHSWQHFRQFWRGSSHGCSVAGLMVSHGKLPAAAFSCRYLNSRLPPHSPSMMWNSLRPQFGRLICALPNLTSLGFIYLYLSTGRTNVAALRRLAPCSRLADDKFCHQYAATGISDALDFFVITGTAAEFARMAWH